MSTPTWYPCDPDYRDTQAELAGHRRPPRAYTKSRELGKSCALCNPFQRAARRTQPDNLPALPSQYNIGGRNLVRQHGFLRRYSVGGSDPATQAYLKIAPINPPDPDPAGQNQHQIVYNVPSSRGYVSITRRSHYRCKRSGKSPRLQLCDGEVFQQDRAEAC